jgi:uncharacterized protein (DUF1684 family)
LALFSEFVSEALDLWDYRRRVSDSYARVRRGGAGPEAWDRWRQDRDHIFASHPQTPVEDPGRFTGLAYFPHDPRWRITGSFRAEEGPRMEMAHSGEGTTPFRRFGWVDFEIDDHQGRLALYWLDTYGGGVFLPFRDLSNGIDTYGGGRYLLDTAKGADLGHEGDGIVFDFNYAYHPSCVHSPRWSCPLSPPENRLDFAVSAGERLGGDHA